MVVATVALVVALGTGGAVAATLITSKQVKNHSLRGVDLKKNTLGGREIAEAKLSKVRSAVRADSAALADAATHADAAGHADSAANADVVGGLGPTAFLRADRVLTASVADSADATGKLLFSDADIGLEVRVGVTSTPRLVNTNGQVPLLVRGVGWYAASNLYGLDLEVAPGSYEDVHFDGAGFGYANVMVLKKTSGGSPPPWMQLTCAYRAGTTPAEDSLSCVGVR
jgi:hypothetical protein